MNPSIKIYVNKIGNRITFEIKTGFYLELLIPETMKITKDKNGEHVPYLEITEVVLIHCNVVNNSYQQNLFLINLLVSYQILIFHIKILYF